jgi:cell division protein FtsW (lipid II flippase)
MKNLIWVHLVFMATGAMLIISAAVIARRRKQGWFKRHRFLALAGVTASSVAFLVIETFKISMNFPHLRSLHSIGGAVSVCLLVITPITGKLIASGGKRLRSLHKTLGRITPVVMLATALMGALNFFKK